MNTALMVNANPHLHEGFSVLRELLSLFYPLSEVKLTYESSMWQVCLDLWVSNPSRVFLSRLVAMTLGLPSYTIRTRIRSSSVSTPVRLVNALQSTVSLEESPYMRHLYVITGVTDAVKAPLATFSSRREAEASVANRTLQNRLTSAKLESFDNLVVEKWRVGEVTEDPHVRQLTVYDVQGTLLLKVPDDTEIRARQTVGRFTSILSSTVLLTQD